jgi:hypothetical protein
LLLFHQSIFLDNGKKQVPASSISLINYINIQLDIVNLGMLDGGSSPDDNNFCPLDSSLTPGRLLRPCPGHSKLHVHTLVGGLLPLQNPLVPMPK